MDRRHLVVMVVLLRNLVMDIKMGMMVTVVVIRVLHKGALLVMSHPIQMITIQAGSLMASLIGNHTFEKLSSDSCHLL